MRTLCGLQRHQISMQSSTAAAWDPECDFSLIGYVSQPSYLHILRASCSPTRGFDYPQDVHWALMDIFVKNGGLSSADAAARVAELAKAQQYVRDIWS